MSDELSLPCLALGITRKLLDTVSFNIACCVFLHFPKSYEDHTVTMIDNKGC